MRAVLQRVSRASVSVDGAVVGEVGAGLMILICAMQGDTEADDDASERAHAGPEDEEEREAREREEAGNAWMVEQGFDSKE